MPDRTYDGLTLDELERRRQAGTPGHWWPRYGGEPGHIYSSQARRVVAELRHEQNDDAPHPDSEMICGAVNAVQSLTDHIRELQARDYEVVLLWLDMQMIHALDAVALGDRETAATHLNAAIERNRGTLEALRARLAARPALPDESAALRQACDRLDQLTSLRSRHGAGGWILESESDIAVGATLTAALVDLGKVESH